MLEKEKPIAENISREGLEYDRIREEFMEKLGIKTLSFRNNKVIENIDGIIKKIRREGSALESI